MRRRQRDEEAGPVGVPGGTRPLRVVMLDPNSHTLPYDRALAAALTAAGCEVELVRAPFIYEALPPAAGYRSTARFFRLAGGRLAQRLGLARRPALRRVLKVTEYPFDWGLFALAVLRRPPDILHVQWSLQPDLDRRLWRWLQGRGVPVAYTVHNLLPHAPAPDDAGRYGRLYAAADALIVHTGRAGDELINRFGVPRERVCIAPHGPLLEEEAAVEPAVARRRLGLPKDDPLILFAGLIEPYKGLPDLAAAFTLLAARHPTARLVVAGRPNVSVDEPRRCLAHAGLAERVHFDLRFLPQVELAAYLCAADVVALPYRAATSSGLLMAARRFGRPVVATAVGDLAALVEDGATGLLVPPGNPPALADALHQLLADPALARRLGEAGRLAAATEQSWAVAAVKTRAAYQAASATRGRG